MGRKVQRFNMTEECNSIGFFISCFRKTHCPVCSIPENTTQKRNEQHEV